MKLIDADTVRRIIDSPRNKTQMLAVLEMMPTVDAVRVIRCKECKYWQNVKGVDGIQKKVCKLWHYETPNEDGFCNHAERQRE